MLKKPSASISKILFSGNDEFTFNEKEKIIIVGPNNSGKSHFLRELFAASASGPHHNYIVVKNLTIFKKGSVDDMKDYLDSYADFFDNKYQHKNWQIQANQLPQWGHDYLTGHFQLGHIKIIKADSRLEICNQQPSIPFDSHKEKPQHILFDDEELMEKISGLFRNAFGKGLMFNFRGGNQLPIHVGEPPVIKQGEDRVSKKYVQKLIQKPLLDIQGDGMKSYAGILFEAIVSNLDITLLDEPEAFLHPPQMKKLGETLSSEVEGQLFVATHSSDILRGFLEGTKGNIRILRMSREGDENFVMEAPEETIKELWQKPNLRYSNALEAVFHEQAIICEDDSDCRLINSIADFLTLESDGQWKDTAYIPTGGKHAIPKVADVLRKIGVPIKAVFDIDFLSEEQLVENSVLAFGGDWSTIKPKWKVVDQAVRDGVVIKSNDEIKAELISILKNTKQENLPKGDIVAALKQDKPWNIIKRCGKTAIPNGQAQSQFNILIDALEDIGIFIIPVGEIENFCPDIGSHGPKFVTNLLTNVNLDDPRLNDLRIFVEKVHKGAHCEF